MTETQEKKRGTGLVVLIGILAFLVGLAAGACALYLFGFLPQKNLGAELASKVHTIDSMKVEIDSLENRLEHRAEAVPARYTEILKFLMQPDSLNKGITLGPSVGGKWQLSSPDDVIFLDEDLLFLRIEDGHMAAQVLLRVVDPADTKTWKMLWGEYQ